MRHGVAENKFRLFGPIDAEAGRSAVHCITRKSIGCSSPPNCGLPLDYVLFGRLD